MFNFNSVVKVKVGHKYYNLHWINSLIDYSYVTDGAGAWVAWCRDQGKYDNDNVKNDSIKHNIIRRFLKRSGTFCNVMEL